MNTVDVLEKLGGSAANFLDTGGKATSDTIKTSFSLILADARVKVVFVNIFGGLTLCDMVAEGIMLAYKTIGIQKPVVVRLRGTNEELGQKMVCPHDDSVAAAMLNTDCWTNVDCRIRSPAARLRRFRGSCTQSHRAGRSAQGANSTQVIHTTIQNSRKFHVLLRRKDTSSWFGTGYRSGPNSEKAGTGRGSRIIFHQKSCTKSRSHI